MEKLNLEDIQNLQKLVSRVKDITGAEALAVAQLQLKLNTMAKELEVPQTPAVEAAKPPKEEKK